MTQQKLYQALNNELKSNHIGATAAELQGFLTGLLAGGYKDDSWKVLSFDMMNDGHPFNEGLMAKTSELFELIQSDLASEEFEFNLLLDDSELHHQIDDLIGWTNYFLLGLGLAQPHLETLKGNVKEAISDLQKVTLLTYDDEEDQEELAFSFEEIKEYVRISAILCYEELSQTHHAKQETLH